MESRIIAIAETYDVLTRGKNYKDKISPRAALEIIEQNATTQFDPVLVKSFVSMMRKDLGLE